MFKAVLFIILLFSCNYVVAGELHDPTLPGNLPAKEITTNKKVELEQVLTLNATWTDGVVNRAMINGSTVRTGQSLADGSVVEKIRPNYVLVKQNGISKKIELVPSIKTPRK